MGMASITLLSGCTDALSSPPRVAITVLNETQEGFRVLLQIEDSEGEAAFDQAVPIVGDAMQVVETELPPGEYQLRGVTEGSDIGIIEDQSSWEISESDCTQHAAVSINSQEKSTNLRVITGTCDSS